MEIKLEHLSKSFGETKVLDDFSLSVSSPVILRAVSGWGKTTLLRILMGLEKADSGKVSGVGQVGVVFQEDRLCPHLNALQNVSLVTREGRGHTEEITADFARLGMGGAALTTPSEQLSGGQKRRVALVRALWTASDTLLLDEPFTGMDSETLHSAAVLLKERVGSRPVLLTTHDRNAVSELGWQVIELS